MTHELEIILYLGSQFSEKKCINIMYILKKQLQNVM